MRFDRRIAIGAHACEEALKVHAQRVLRVMLDRNQKSAVSRKFASQAETLGLNIEYVTGRKLDALGTGHQGIAVELESESDEFHYKPQERDLILACDGLEDPHNLGAIIRTAWLLGVRALVASKSRSVGLTPTVHKVACGGVEHVEVSFVSKLTDFLPKLKDQGFWAYGLAGEPGSRIYTDVQYPAKTVLVVGAEEKGLRQSTRKACDELVEIPMVAEGASFNASVAAAIVMSEFSRQMTQV